MPWKDKGWKIVRETVEVGGMGMTLYEGCPPDESSDWHTSDTSPNWKEVKELERKTKQAIKDRKKKRRIKRHSKK